MGFFNKSAGGRGPKRFGERGGAGGRGGFGGRPSGGRGGFGGGFAGGEREMFSTTCHDCGNACQVPFRPTGAKPVFCNNCFDGAKERPSFGDRERSFDRPRFERQDRFESKPQPQPKSDELAQMKVQLDIMHNKLDRILKLVSPTVVIEPVVEEETPAAEEKPKAKRASKK